MLSIVDPHANVLSGAFHAPGGFAWWYADLLDADGNGVVLIPSWGLPFLPGHASAARAARAAPASDRPALAVSIYERGRPAYYLLQEIDPANAVREGHTLYIGDSVLRFSPGRLRARLDLDAPGGRLRGEVSVDGVARVAGAQGPLSHDDHEWCPLVGPAEGRWDLTAGTTRFEGRGSAYLDRNAGRTDLEHLGIRQWIWCRAQLPDRLRVGYALWPDEGDAEAVIVDVHADGRTETHAATFEGVARRNLYGLDWWPAWTLRSGDRVMAARVTARPDDSPFYQRNLAVVSTEVGEAPGIGEVCDSRRIDRAWMRPFVSMCVHRPEGPNSLMTPWFSGPRRGRLSRLLGAA